jgi:WD40 repeat protein
MNTLTEFEKDIQLSYALPEPRSEFLGDLAAKIRTKKQPVPRNNRRSRLAWVGLTLVVFLVLTLALLGPGKVWAQIQSWFGLLPGVGVIEPGTSIRMLKEPVSQTRDGITVEVSEAILTNEQSFIYFNASNIPTTAYSGNEGKPGGCQAHYYLETEDGQRFQPYGEGEFELIPANINTATLVIPCLRGTLPGSTPENWRLQLEFVPFEGPPVATPVYLFPTATLVENKAGIVISHSLVEGDNLVLAGYIRNLDEKYRNLVGNLEIFDADQQPVPFLSDQSQLNLANATRNQLGAWTVRLKPEGLAFPLEIRQSYLEVSQPLEDESTAFLITLPAEYPLNDISVQKSIDIAGESIELYFLRIQPSQFGGYQYDFYFKAHPVIRSLDVSTPGSSLSNVAGSTGASLKHGESVFQSSFWLEEGSLHGDIEFEVSHPVKVLETIELTHSFTPPADLMSELEAQSGSEQACIDYLYEIDENDGQIPQLKGKVLVYQESAPFEGNALVLYSLDGSDRLLIGKNLVHSALSPDGQTLALIRRDEGLRLLDLASETEQHILDIQGNDLRWSPDGQWIALQTYEGVLIVKVDGNKILLPDDQGNGNIAGWSADSERLYFRKTSAAGAQGRLFVYSLDSDQTQQSDLLDSKRTISSGFSLSADERYAIYPKSQLDWMYEDLQTGEVKALSDGVWLGSPVWLNDGWVLFTQYDQFAINYLQPVAINPATCQVVHLPERLGGLVLGVWLEQ